MINKIDWLAPADRALAGREHAGLRIGVSVGDPGMIPRSEGKAARIIDLRG